MIIEETPAARPEAQRADPARGSPAAGHAPRLPLARLHHGLRDGRRRQRARPAAQVPQCACARAGHRGDGDRSGDLQHRAGRRQDSVHLLRPGRRREHRRLQRADRAAGRAARFPHHRRLREARPAGQHGCPNSSTTNFINTEFGLAFHSDGAILRGMLERTSAATRALTNGARHRGALRERYGQQSAQPDVRHHARPARGASC